MHQNITEIEAATGTLQNLLIQLNPGLLLLIGIPMGMFSKSVNNKPQLKIINGLQLILSMLIVVLTTSYTMNVLKEEIFDGEFPGSMVFSSSIVYLMGFLNNLQLIGILFGMYMAIIGLKLLQKVFYGDESIENKQKTPALQENNKKKRISVLSWLTYGWCTELVLKGYRGKLEREDRFELQTDDSTTHIVQQFEEQWDQEINKLRTNSSTTDSNRTPKLLKCLIKAFGPLILTGALYKFVACILGLCLPYILRLLIQFTEDTTQLQFSGYMYAALMFIFAVSQTLSETQQGESNCTNERRVWTAITSTIYKKTLKLSNTAKKSSTSGEIVNLMSVDAGRVSSCMHSVNDFWSTPFMFCSTMFLLWQTLGVSALIGLSIMVVILPLNSYLAKKGKDLHLQVMDLKDSRIKMMNEVLNGIKVLKLYAWEYSFEKQINDIREKEMKVIRNQALAGCLMHLAWCITPFLVSLGSFAVYVLIDDENILSAEKAFVALALFEILSRNLTILPHIVNHYVQANVALKRIQTFLEKEELTEDAVTRNVNTDKAIAVEDATFSWSNTASPTLKEINVNISEGQFVAVVGSVGSGKSSLLSALLGEMEPVKGKTNIKGSIAYVSQQAWIRNATIENNILFGEELNKSKYEDILHATTLDVDLDMLSGGDQTEIGEKGINLSGGQKQRISLARAVYQDADVYLLDDPLSAVDAHVGKHIFDNVLDKKGKLGKKTRVLVTNSVSFLPKTDMIIVMDKGRISEVGSFQELVGHKGAFSEFLDNYMINKDDALSGATDIEEVMNSKEDNVKKSTKKEKGCEKKEEKTKTHIINEETNDCTKPRMEVFLFYLKSIGFPTACLIIISNIIFNVAERLSDIWISDWTSDDMSHLNGTAYIEQRNLRLTVYSCIGVLQAFLLMIVGAAVANARMKASKKLHQEMLRNVLRSPMSFFDSTPVGRIVTRFSNDVSKIDNEIIYQFKDCLISVAGVIINASIISMGTPMFLFVLIPVTVLYFVLQRIYANTSTQLMRFETATNSPIYSQFSETISGTATIRAYAQQEKFIAESAGKVDDHKRSQLSARSVGRWLSIRLEFLGALIVLCVCLLAVIGRGTVSPGVVGLCITYALGITGSLQWVVRVTAILESNTVSLEKIQEYTETQTEAPWEIQDSKPSENWPEKGCVEFQDYGVRYREGLDLVIKGITCKIQPGEKIGIVGRTGAGKSSLTLALFRILESSKGKITVDGIDISTIGLHNLRSRITIIPQDPVLFSGTMRMNLDPFNEYTDEEIWTSLEHAHLHSFVEGLDGGLEHKCSEGGENLSVGQRQLVCLARALLRKTKVLVLDEATAAVDLETDDLIQNTIRSEFNDCTILTIAHRLNTIMDYTRIMVLDAGRIQEFDTPTNLIENTDSSFHSMAKNAGLVTK